MTFAGLNILAIVAAAVAGWLFGAAYYSLLAKPWLAAQGRTRAEIEAIQAARGAAAYLPFAAAFVAELVMAWVLSGMMGHIGAVTIRSGVITALFVWVGFVATTLTVNTLFGSRNARLALIDGGHWLGVLVTMGFVIGAFGV